MVGPVLRQGFRWRRRQTAGISKDAELQTSEACLRPKETSALKRIKLSLGESAPSVTWKCRPAGASCFDTASTDQAGPMRAYER